MNSTKTIIFILIALAIVGLIIFYSGEIKPKTDKTEYGNIDYRKSGGFAGVNDQLVICANGIANFNGFERTLTGDELDEVNKVFTENKFFDLPGETVCKNCADFFRFSLTYDLKNKSKKVTAEGPETPRAITNIVEALEKIIDKDINDKGEKIEPMKGTKILAPGVSPKPCAKI